MIDMIRNHLYNEILEEPTVLRRVYRAYIEDANPALDDAVQVLHRGKMIIMTGMVTSMFGCIPAQCLLSAGGQPSYLVDASEYLHYHLDMTPEDAVFILVSQSGESAEILHLLDNIGKRWQTIGIYNNENSTLAKNSTVGLPIYAGPQLACGSKTNTGTMAVMNILAETVLGTARHKIGEQIEKAITELESLFNDWEEKIAPAVSLLENSAYTVFIGRGPGLASASFSSVLFREVPKVVAEGLPAANFRHGLREMMTPDHRIVAFAPAGRTADKVISLTNEMLSWGVPSLVFTNIPSGKPSSDKQLIFKTAPISEYYCPLFDIAPPQLIGLKMALNRGLEPGKLVISDYVTKVE